MENTINSRIGLVMEKERMNVSAFSKSLNKSYTATDSVIKGKSKPGYDFLEAIMNVYPHINPGWLVAGEGEMFKQAAPAPSASADSYLSEHLKTLEENFARLASQLEAKDKQLEAAIETSRGLQRTVDALISRSVTATGNFLNDVAAHRSGSRKRHTTQQVVEPVLVAVA